MRMQTERCTCFSPPLAFPQSTGTSGYGWLFYFLASLRPVLFIYATLHRSWPLDLTSLLAQREFLDSFLGFVPISRGGRLSVAVSVLRGNKSLYDSELFLENCVHLCTASNYEGAYSTDNRELRFPRLWHSCAVSVDVCYPAITDSQKFPALYDLSIRSRKVRAWIPFYSHHFRVLNPPTLPFLQTRLTRASSRPIFPTHSQQ